MLQKSSGISSETLTRVFDIIGTDAARNQVDLSVEAAHGNPANQNSRTSAMIELYQNARDYLGMPAAPLARGRSYDTKSVFRNNSMAMTLDTATGPASAKPSQVVQDYLASKPTATKIVPLGGNVLPFPGMTGAA